MTGPEASEDPVDALQRWEAFGGVWRVVFRDASQVTVSLCRCDGGEEVARFSSADRELLDYLDTRPAAEA